MSIDGFTMLQLDFRVNVYIKRRIRSRRGAREEGHDFLLGRDAGRLGIPGIHGPLAEDELDGYVQSGVYLIRGQGENLLIDSGNWTLPEYNNGMGDFLIERLDREKNPLKYLFITHFHYDHVGNALMLKKRYGATVVCHPLDRPIIEDPDVGDSRGRI